MILELDIGNSQIKWRLLSTDQTGIANSVEDCCEAFETLPIPHLVRLASVRYDNSVSRLAEWTDAHWSIRPLVAVVTSECGGVINSYAEPHRLGVDRWLAILSAYQRVHSACVIVDSGTAITIDALDSKGRHRGGYIVPGFSLAIDSLETKTGIRLKSRNFQQLSGLGTSTEQAVLQGILNQVVALIEKVVAGLNKKENTIPVLLSGGNATLLQGSLRKSGLDRLEVCPSLVLDGLALVKLEKFA
ncbi:MAG: type III pantothenate kinase [Gammaproteobacteria bacterium]|nr:type III pantothenate kinase [Gammaproteobacteria bacterium]MCY4358005.1 type III pantothenate kinase [Gammaproteobacteria bacterium]